MPSKSPAQARLMAAAAHTPGGYGGVPQAVGRDFNQADKGSKLLSRANAKRKRLADGGLATEISGSEFPAPDAPVRSITEAPAIRRTMQPSGAQPTTSQSEGQRRTLGRLATGIRG